MKSRIHYTKPSITEKEVEYATDAARNGFWRSAVVFKKDTGVMREKLQLKLSRYEFG